MKYIKHFESIYNVGEFVVINTQNLTPQPSENIGQIIKKTKLGEFESSIIYQIELPINPSSGGTIKELHRKDLLRYAFPEEIKEYEIKKAANKFNL